MMGFVTAVIIVAVFGSLIWLMWLAADGSVLAGAAAIVLVTVVLSVVINSSIKTEAEGPCHEYKTQLLYNAATKTMMPSRVCVLRGEWVGDQP